MTQEEKARAMETIPFGAQDSELKGWEYTIPEGMEAIIKDGKVIVREMESEDERIRKWIIEEFKLHYDFESKSLNPMVEKALAWLEKQKEQKPESDVRVRYKTRKECYLKGLEAGRKEQKSTPDWMPKFLDELRSMKNYFDWDERRDIEGKILAIINWIAPNYFNEKEKEQKSAELSEEEAPDETKQEWRNSIDIPGSIKTSRIETLENLISYFKYERKATQEEIRISFIPCLENLLKDVENTNYHAEWSEEDEKKIRFLSRLIEFQVKDGEYCFGEGSRAISKQEAISMLKSLRPQHHWKPSEEQMEALERASTNEYLSARQYDILVSLYEQLTTL